MYTHTNHRKNKPENNDVAYQRRKEAMGTTLSEYIFKYFSPLKEGQC